MHVHAVIRVHAVTPKLVICVYVFNVNFDGFFWWQTVSMPLWSNDRAAHTDTNPKNLELAPPQSIKATRLDQLVYSPNYYIQFSRLKKLPTVRVEPFTMRTLSLTRSHSATRAIQQIFIFIIYPLIEFYLVVFIKCIYVYQ